MPSRRRSANLGVLLLVGGIVAAAVIDSVTGGPGPLARTVMSEVSTAPAVTRTPLIGAAALPPLPRRAVRGLLAIVTETPLCGVELVDLWTLRVRPVRQVNLITCGMVASPSGRQLMIGGTGQSGHDIQQRPLRVDVTRAVATPIPADTCAAFPAIAVADNGAVAACQANTPVIIPPRGSPIPFAGGVQGAFDGSTLLTVSPSGRASSAWAGLLGIRPGDTPFTVGVSANHTRLTLIDTRATSSFGQRLLVVVPRHGIPRRVPVDTNQATLSGLVASPAAELVGVTLQVPSGPGMLLVDTTGYQNLPAAATAIPGVVGYPLTVTDAAFAPNDRCAALITHPGLLVIATINPLIARYQLAVPGAAAVVWLNHG